MNARTIVTALTLAALMYAPQPVSADAGFDLLTPGEIALRRDIAPTRNLDPLKTDGPEIRIHAPQSSTLASPVDFDVEILPRDGVEPDLASLQIEYRIGPIWTDVTDRLRANAEFVGLRMRAPGARLPSGKHNLRLTIEDIDGGVTIARLSFTVNE